MKWDRITHDADISEDGRYRVIRDQNAAQGLPSRYLAFRGADDPDAASECLGWFTSAALGRDRCERDAAERAQAVVT